ncbi:MAG TPA: efflux RND transporter periplasmic adaptor subunit [Flavisolibacter sp.]
MNKTVKWILIIMGALVVVLLAVKMMGKDKEQGIKVTAEAVQQRTITETVTASGKIYPEVEVPISPDISGEVTELYVEEGDSVRKGQVLARIYADVYASQRDEASSRVAASQANVANSQAQLGALKAQLNQDRQAYDRNKQLFDDKVISRAELEGFETRYRSSEAQYNAALQNIRSLQASTQSTRSSLEMANKNLSRATITAPMNGIVSMLKVKRGEKVVGTAQMAGTELMTIADMSAIEVRVQVGENDIVKVSIGDSADVKVEAYNNRRFRGVVTKIASSTARTGGATSVSANDATEYAVHVRLDPASYSDLVNPAAGRIIAFRPGMNASADIKTTRVDNATSVPVMAVAARVKGSDQSIEERKKEKDKQAKNATETEETTQLDDELEEVVFVIKADNTLEKRTITTGIQDVNYIQVLGGLKPGEKVVTAPYNAISKTLKPGDKIRVVTRDELVENK